MIQARLNDAAIALSRILHEAGTKHGVFGGFAIVSLGETKDIDCIASVSKQQVIQYCFLAMLVAECPLAVQMTCHSRQQQPPLMTQPWAVPQAVPRLGSCQPE
jgi:hypothetical protein